MKIDPLDLMGPGEIAAYCKVHPTTVSRWIAAGVLPAPIQVLAAIPIWDRRQIEDFEKDRRR